MAKQWKGSGAPTRAANMQARAARKEGCFGVSCQVCDAQPGQPCRNERNVIVRAHTVRRMKYKASKGGAH